MVQSLENLAVADGDPVRTEHIAAALTAGGFVYADGATQTFEPGGGTTYVEHERRSHGKWYVDSEGRFCSFWPPSYRACYDLHWIVENGSVVGLRFTELERESGRPCDINAVDVHPYGRILCDLNVDVADASYEKPGLQW